MGNVEKILVIVIMATIVVILALAIWGLGQDEPYWDEPIDDSPGREVLINDRSGETDGVDGSAAGSGEIPAAGRTPASGSQLMAPPAGSGATTSYDDVSGDDGGRFSAGLERPMAEVTNLDPPSDVDDPVTPTPRSEPRPSRGGPSLRDGLEPSHLAGLARYRISRGDTYSDLAQRYLGSSKRWQAIVDANKDVDPNRLTVGLEILIPITEAASGEMAASPVRSDSSRALSSMAPARKAGGAKDARTYVTQKGDTLYAIARRELQSGGRWQEIYDLNRSRIPDPNDVPVGLSLLLPKER